MKVLLILVTFSQSPQGVWLEQVGSYGSMKACMDFAKARNIDAKSTNEVLTCMRVDV